MSDTDHDAIFLRLKHAMQLLACSADVQLFILPDFVCKGDELALDFDHWREVVQGNYPSELTPEQLKGLIDIDQQLDAITAWSDEAVRTSSVWEAVRSKAKQALTVFGWPLETPPSYAHEYVSGDPRAKTYFQ